MSTMYRTSIHSMNGVKISSDKINSSFDTRGEAVGDRNENISDFHSMNSEGMTSARIASLRSAEIFNAAVVWPLTGWITSWSSASSTRKNSTTTGSVNERTGVFGTKKEKKKKKKKT